MVAQVGKIAINTYQVFALNRLWIKLDMLGIFFRPSEVVFRPNELYAHVTRRLFNAC